MSRPGDIKPFLFLAQFLFWLHIRLFDRMRPDQISHALPPIGATVAVGVVTAVVPCLVCEASHAIIARLLRLVLLTISPPEMSNGQSSRLSIRAREPSWSLDFCWRFVNERSSGVTLKMLDGAVSVRRKLKNSRVRASCPRCG
ncbi:uncharacterized protein B0T23DRAFT_381508 [Neurospora hispaniola]|uniref:Uncharacterized protein n=1 Tax=Neurospora hispaniola TaxID=588809 RepID=A0AAJ0I5G2_9PEZI|nr:hypothetical protein B0T23DRAFT_381508 [Neurospora hispaniola]